MSFKNVKAFFRRSLNDARVSGKSKQYHSMHFNAIANKAATGGTIVEPGNGYRYYFFTSPGTFVVHVTGVFDIEIIAGGGGGGGQEGGGGGGGGIVTRMSQPMIARTYNVTVGNGGPASPLNGRGVAGDPSSVIDAGLGLFNYTAAGGGYGGGGSGGQPGGAGGSGGGARISTPPGAVESGGTGNTPPVSPPQGSPGAPGTSAGSGGGGGGNPLGGPTGSGAGGIGRGLFPIGLGVWDSGVPSDYGETHPDGYQIFAGGGAGSRSSTTGGVGGGGDYGQAGQANTGGGGGGGGNPGSGSAGGSGLVVFRQQILR